MFGRKKATAHGTATVVLSQYVDNGRVKYDHGVRVHRHDMILDVRPDDGSPMFRTEASDWFDVMHAPRKGDVVKVSIDADHKSVEVDVSDDPRFNLGLAQKAKKGAKEDERRRLLEGPPGSS